MKKLLTIAGLVATLLLLIGATPVPAASGTNDGTATTLAQPRPTWLTDELEAQIIAAGPKGLEVALAPSQALQVNCLGTAPPYAGADGVSVTAVAAGTCMVSPHGCT